MVEAARRDKRRHQIGGFALAELIISTSIFSAVSAGLLLGFISLKRNYAATTDFAINHADQMRISDYLALDFRRTISVQAAANDTTLYIPAYYDSSDPPQPRNPVLDGKGGIFYGPPAQATTTAPLPTSTYTDFTTTSPAKFVGTSGPLIINGYTVAPGDTVFVRHQTPESRNGLYVVNAPGSGTTSWSLTAHAFKIRYYLSNGIIYRDEQGALNQPTALAREVQDFVFEPSDLGKVIKTTIKFNPTFRSVGASDAVRNATAFYNTTLLRNNRGVY